MWCAPAAVASAAFSSLLTVREHRRARPGGELDRGVADRARAAVHQDDLPGQRAGRRAGRQRGPEVSARCAVIAGTPRQAPRSKAASPARVGQRHDPVPVKHAVLGGRAVRRPVLPEVQPDPVAGRAGRARPRRPRRRRPRRPGPGSPRRTPCGADDDRPATSSRSGSPRRGPSAPGPGPAPAQGTGRSASRRTLDGPFSA